jgi:hypothetical protein
LGSAWFCRFGAHFVTTGIARYPRMLWVTWYISRAARRSAAANRGFHRFAQKVAFFTSDLIQLNLLPVECKLKLTLEKHNAICRKAVIIRSAC